jgi:hypothetical protein
MTEKPRSKDPELSQYESEEDFVPQKERPDEAMSDVDATLDGNEEADDRVRIEQPDGQRAPRASSGPAKPAPRASSGPAKPGPRAPHD